MQSPNSEEHDSGSICEGICKSSISKHMDSDLMERIYACICDKKNTLRNSVKLKSQIHAQINELIEILRERECQLCLEIDEINIDHCDAVRIIAELCNYASSESSRANTPIIKQSAPGDDQENQRVHSTTFLNSELELVSNFNDVKAILKNFGQIKKSELFTESSEEESIENILDNQLTDDQVSNASSAADSIENLTEHFERSKVERLRKDSSGSADSFEVIDPCDEAFLQFTEIHKQQDEMDQVSDSSAHKTVAENQVLLPSNSPAAAHEPHQRYKLKTHWMIDSKRLREVLNHKKKKKSKSATKLLWPPADCRISPPLDPTKGLRKQLKEMSVSKKPSQNAPCTDHDNERPKDMKYKEEKVQHVINPLIPSNLGNRSSPLKIDSKSCFAKSKPVPSAMIQETFGKFLDLNSPDKWLASKKCFQTSIKSDCHLFNAKRLHFQVQ